MRAKPFTVCLSSLVAFWVACGLVTDESNAPPGIKLLVSPTALTVTDTLHLSLSNVSTARAGYNLCFVSLDRKVADRWAAFPSASSRPCTMELRVLLPGQTARSVLVLPGSVPPGTYRVRTGIEWPLNSRQHEVISEQFSVRP
jgi:hypothetical protein